MFLAPVIKWWSSWRLDPRWCFCSLFIPWAPPTSSRPVLCLALMTEWLTPLNWTPSWDLSPKLHACVSNTHLMVLRGRLKGVSDATWSKRCTMSPGNTYSSSSVSSLSDNGTDCPVVTTTDLWDILNAFFSFTPVANPSSSLLAFINCVSFQSIHFPSCFSTPVSSSSPCFSSQLLQEPLSFLYSGSNCFFNTSPYCILFYLFFNIQYYSGLVSGVQHSRQSHTL